jgi:hypothetical protein
MTQAKVARKQRLETALREFSDVQRKVYSGYAYEAGYLQSMLLGLANALPAHKVREMIATIEQQSNRIALEK